MEALRTYLLSVTAAAVICGIASRLLGKKGTPAALGNLMCGVFLTLAVMQPLSRFRGSLNIPMDFASKAEQAAALGQAEAKKAMSAIIKERSEAYILEKAALYQTELTVEVTLSDDEIPQPESVRLQGAVSPNIKALLQSIIAEKLGISKEKQVWI